MTDAEGKQNEAYLTPRANGINAFQNLHGAAWLGSIKLSDKLLEFLRLIWGRRIAQERTLREFEFYPCMQFLARISSRRFDSADKVIYVVADKEQAAYVERVMGLNPATPMPVRDALRQQLDDTASKGRGRKPSKGEEDRRAEIRAKDRLRKAEQRAANSKPDTAKSAKRAADATKQGRAPGRNGRPKKP